MFKRVLLLASLLFLVCFSARSASLTAGIGSFPTSSNCTYQTFNFTDASTYTGSNKGSNRVKWSFGDGGTDTGASVFKTYSATGTYTIKLVITNTKDNIKDSTTKSITISLAGIKPGFAIIGRPCQRVELKIINKAVPLPKSGVLWSWTFGDASTSTSTDSFIHVYANSGTYVITQKITAANGCISSTSLTEVIKVTPQAKAAKPGQHCEDSATTFDATSTVTNGLNVGYTWSFQDNTTLSGAKVSKVLPAKTYTATLAVINNTNGCNDTLPVAFTVYSKPAPAFNYVPVCQDSIATFTDATYIKYGPTTITSWHWTFSDSLHHNYETPFDAYSDTTIVQHGFPHGGIFNVNLTVLTKVGCTDSATQQIYINPTPTPRFFFKNTCQDSAIQFSDSSIVPAGNKITGWLWNFGDSNSQHKPYTSTLQHPTHQYAKPGYGYKVKLVVMTQSGCKDSLTKKVIAYPSPVSTYAFSSKCANDQVNFLNSSLMPSTAVNDSIKKFRWEFGDGNTDSVENAAHSYRKSGTYTVKLISYSGYGCTDTGKSSILIYPLPLPSFKLQGNCERDSVQFVNTSTTAYGSLIDSSYTFDYGDSTISNNIINPNHLFKHSGTFNVTLTAVAKGAGCIGDTTIAVKIIPGPHSEFTWVASCFKQPITFTNVTKSNSPGKIQYMWDFGDGTTDTTKNPTHTYTTIKNFHVKLTSTMPATGCVDSMIHFVSVSPIPIARYYAKNVCNDSAVTFSDSSKLATNYYFKSFDFDFGDGSTGKGPKTTHKYAVPGIYTVKEVVTGTTGCQDSFTMNVSTFKIPTSKFSYIKSCTGTPTPFTDLTDPSDSINKWTWIFSSTDTTRIYPPDAVHDPSHVYKNSDIADAELRVSTAHGCTNSSFQSVDVKYEPEPTFIPPTGCNGRGMAFFGSQKNKGTVNVVSYSWDFGDGKTSTDLSTNHTFDSSGSFIVGLKETSDQGCSNTDSETVKVTKLPTALFSFQGNCFGETYYFLDSSLNGTGDLRFWDFGDGLNSTDQSPTHKYASPGTYTVKMWIETDPEGCISDTSFNYKIVVNPLPLAKFGWDTACFGDPTAFHDSSNAFGSRIQKYQWIFNGRAKDSVPNPFYVFPDTFKGLEDTFRTSLKITTNFGCIGNVSKLSYVKQRPKALFDVSPSPITIQHPEVTFTNKTSYADTSSYYWNFGDGFDSHRSNPKHTYNDTGTYIVTLSAVSKRGCVDTFRYTLFVTPGYSIFAPNAMTVNGDGVNDEWQCKGVGVIDFDVVIVDIWGQVVFHSTDINKTWQGDYRGDGVKVPEGMYIYYVKAGNFANTDFTTLKGNITLVR